MGNRWTVSSYVRPSGQGGYSYEQVYAGQSVFGALAATVRAKRSGAGCVKIEWR